MPAPSGIPALYLYPLNDSFVPKHIGLVHNQRVKIGRQTNAKTTPGERNGYFDSKVLSRQHAEVWEEGGKIFIKDVKSSNGTFINGERLSPEGLESDPYELKSDDIVEFGIDILGEDNKTIIHHKVAARVLCILSEQDAQMAARAEQHQMQQHTSLHQQQQQTQQQQMQQGGPGGSAFNFSGGAGQPPPRRPQMSQQGMAGMGGMGGSMRPPGKSGLTFDHILNRLQGELQKSRETGAELHSLTGAMNEIHDTLGAGNMPHNPPPNPHTLPPVRPRETPEQVNGNGDHHHDSSSSSSPPPESHLTDAPGPSSSPPPPAPSETLITDLQSQLKDTQSSLAIHVDRIRVLEGALKEQETMRNEMSMLKQMMDALQRRERDLPPSQSQAPSLPRSDVSHAPEENFEEGDEDDVDDSRSVATVVPHELERVEEEDEEEATNEEEESPHHVDELDIEESSTQEEEEDDEERRRRREELGRPRTPEPTGLGMHVKINGHHHAETTRNRSKTLTGRTTDQNATLIEELNARLASFTSQLANALELSKGLQKEHREAQEVIRTLEQKVEGLEDVVRTTLTKQQEPKEEEPKPAPVVASEPKESETASLTSMIMEWKSHVEGQWSSVREEWSEERQRLVKAREEWENKMKGEWESKVREVDTGLERIDKMEKEIIQDREAREKERAGRMANATSVTIHANGDALKYHGGGVGLVTPPSPRSVSSDYDYTSSTTSWSGRPRKRSRSGSAARRKVRGLRRSTSRGADTDDTEETLAVDENFNFAGLGGKDNGPIEVKHKAVVGGTRLLITPESTLIYNGDVGDKSSLRGRGHDDDNQGPLDAKRNARQGPIQLNHVNVQTAMGVLVLSVAAAAVVWRVKPE
ncbi:hypothetical protein PM082_004203 [Marasmius tenuissimus]|nr:hypothetical protein PM082_004203 [Marasmius tenuissimus]